jgi:hypothetical protein
MTLPIACLRTSEEPSPADVAVSARPSTLECLLDRGYVFSQVLALQKLLDNGNDVTSIKRLLKDVRHSTRPSLLPNRRIVSPAADRSFSEAPPSFCDSGARFVPLPLRGQSVSFLG